MTDGFVMNDYNSKNRIGLRKYGKNLELSGKAFILFGLWTVVKIFMMFTMNRENLENITDGIEFYGMTDFQIWIVYGIVFLFIALFIMYFHLRIGRSAIRYGRGKKRKKGFLITGGIMIMIILGDIPMYFVDEKGNHISADPTILASILVDLTIVFIFLDMIYSIIMLEKCRRSMEREETSLAG